MEILQNCDWPENIRELRNLVERVVLMTDGNILLPCHRPPDVEAAGAADETGEVTSTLSRQRRR